MEIREKNIIEFCEFLGVKPCQKFKIDKNTILCITKLGLILDCETEEEYDVFYLIKNKHKIELIKDDEQIFYNEKELTILNLLYNLNFKYIAKDIDGSIFAYEKVPHREYEGYWVIDSANMLDISCIGENLFQDIEYFHDAISIEKILEKYDRI